MTRRYLAAVSLKAYFGHAETLDWVSRAAVAARPYLDRVDVLLMPSATALVETIDMVRGTGILVGAQDCSAAPQGPFTGELPATLLAEIGVSAVELGHAERRRLFADDDVAIALKAAAAVGAGLTPVLCVGESVRVSPEEAAAGCVAQVDAVFATLELARPVIVAYEPVWAIGAQSPAGAEHIRPVCRAIGDHIRQLSEDSRVIYGGTAGPGLFASVYPYVDGLFLGRRAHDVNAFALAVSDMAELALSRGSGHAAELEMAQWP
jgi:triosephosphate isomerase (TIM)